MWCIICAIISSLKFSSKNKVFYIYKKLFNKQSIINFKIKLFDIDWQETETLHNPCSVYAYFLEQFSTLYDYIFYIIFFFPLMALKYLLNGSSVSITDFLNRNEKNETEHKNCKNIFQAIKKVLKRTTLIPNLIGPNLPKKGNTYNKILWFSQKMWC